MLNQHDSPLPSKPWPWKKILLLLVGLFAVFTASILSYDSKLEPYDDLIPKVTSAPETNNGYLYLKERWEKLPKPPSEDREKLQRQLTGGEIWDAEWIGIRRVDAVSIANDVKQALQLPHFSTPVIPNLASAATDSHTWVVNPVRLMILEAEARRRSGDWEGALSLRADLQEMIHRYIKGSNSLISLLVAASLHSMTAEITCHLVENVKDDRGKLMELAETTPTELIIFPIWEEVIKHETMLSRDALEKLSRGINFSPGFSTKWREKLFLKPNQTINRLHSQRRALLAHTREGAPAAAILPDSDLASRMGWMHFLDANYYGTALLASGDGLGKIWPGLVDNLSFRPRALRVRIAIHLWQLEHPGQWPATLQELVPQFLSEVPADPWKDQPLTWDAVSKIITGVGSDGLPGPAKFTPGRRGWFAENREAPGLRMELPPLPPASAPKSSAKKAASMKTKPAPGPTNPEAPVPAPAIAN